MGCKGGKRKRGKKHQKNTALKRKQKNGNPEIETYGVNEMAKEGIKCEQEGTQKICKICRWHEIRRAN